MSLEDHVGFTGTRKGMSIPQTISVRGILLDRTLVIKPEGLRWFHHGNCIGADFEATLEALKFRYKIYRHPPLDRSMEAQDLHFDAEDPRYSYHGRNQRICMVSNTLIAAPYDLQQKGGTWWTINCARRIGLLRFIVHRDGSVIKEEGS